MSAVKCRRKKFAYEAMKLSGDNVKELADWSTAENYTIDDQRIILRINWINYVLPFGDVLVHDLVLGKWMVLSYSDFYEIFDYQPFSKGAE